MATGAPGSVGIYATVEDLRDEGISEQEASDERLSFLLEEASRKIDGITGWWFEPRTYTFLLDGRGAPSIELPVPLIRLDLLQVEGKTIPSTSISVVGAPVLPGVRGFRITSKWNRFPRGLENVRVEGLWGYTEEDGSLEGRVPLEIRRACMLLVIDAVHLLGDLEELSSPRNRWRLIEERIRDQSYKLGTPEAPGVLSGDPEVDRILSRYSKPIFIGAA